ncbi:MAG: hypothetical protein R3C68_06775 [Myxococcota bacterium]
MRESGTLRGCYEGPSETLDVGACSQGQQRCVGVYLGACEGAVMPVVEPVGTAWTTIAMGPPISLMTTVRRALSRPENHIAADLSSSPPDELDGHCL